MVRGGRVRPDWTRLSPRWSLDSLAGQFAGIMLAIGALGLVAWALAQCAPGVVGRVGLGPRAAWRLGEQVLGTIAWRLGAGLALAGAVALVYRRWRYFESMKMSRQELLEERRQTEGEPEAKRQRARRQRQLALTPSVEEVASTAAVVVVGDRAAVAVGWDGERGAPHVLLVARGLTLRALVRAARVTVRDPGLVGQLAPLARGKVVPRGTWPRLAQAMVRIA